MKRIQYHEYGGPETMQLEDFELEMPGKGQVAVKVKFAAINPIDWKVRNGYLKMVTGRAFPRAMGSDFSGTVISVGAGVTRVKPGDAVFGLAQTSARRRRSAGVAGFTAMALLVAAAAVARVIIRGAQKAADRNAKAAVASEQIAQSSQLQAEQRLGEVQRKAQETEITFRNEARKDLGETMAKLKAINEGAVALADKVDKAQVKSPVRGRVQRLLANTVGGVVQPGKDIVEIVPLDDTLVLEARVAPKDIAFIHPGQAATVKFTAYDFSIYGGLEAKVENISPDSVIDEKGNAYYLVRVRTVKAGFSEKLPIIPGMTAEVDVLTGRKSVLSYLLKPVLKVQSRAMSER